ncbi:TorD/DmsD family molecular chaperone [Vibrio porteresiae]|uniref:Molecular chaperone n=1 Tax=Vibrio porteresiae DSM 19223 TaxID=1123496 RepID=A0ABZ0QG60_9VIBR|nr:molecular chaperone [Vibrio porteresiae]WPC75182.1 molecular chaperone [Vibrio porteresiae DSM 19223]
MSKLAILPRLLGSLMYLSPSSETNQSLFEQLDVLTDVFPWHEEAQVKHLLDELIQTRVSATDYTFSVLFEGQGEMVAPPWGSVYQEKENIVMGESTGRWDLFVKTYGMELTDKIEPNDQYGLMLWAMAALLEDGQEEAVVTLLEQHLLPWAYRYLELLATNQESAFYAALAQLNTLFLQQLEQQMALSPNVVQLYK